MNFAENEENLIEKKRISAERDRLMKVWEKSKISNNSNEEKEIIIGNDNTGDNMIHIDTRFFWYYDEGVCWVDPDISIIPSIDKANKIIWMEDRYISTEIFSTQPGYTIDEYHQHFCKLDTVSGKWFYKN
jgi:hypothetical protein